MEINILYEDKDIIAVDKPAGLIVHTDGRTKESTLTDWILEKYPETKNVGELMGDIERPGIVHRLDRDTSGVILIAKTKEGHKCLKDQFQNRTIKKKYLAFVYGEMKDEYGIIDRPIGRSSTDFRKWSATRGTRGEMREANTYWNLIAKKDGYSLIEVEPKTGRTHQIRVHMKAINYPIVSDKLYANTKSKSLGFIRTALHSYYINFKNYKGKNIEIVASLPDDFKYAIKKLDMEEFAKSKGIC
ncbi:MAG TPA: RluA family pseudouridine synthase [Candidatus Paceibacterota bacterium]